MLSASYSRKGSLPIYKTDRTPGALRGNYLESGEVKDNIQAYSNILLIFADKIGEGEMSYDKRTYQKPGT